jgi:hypothetical protein
MIEFGLLRPSEHQAHSAAIEKRKPRRGLEQQLQPQNILIESGGTIHVVRVDGDLPDPRNSGSRFSHILSSSLL